MPKKTKPPQSLLLSMSAPQPSDVSRKGSYLFFSDITGYDPDSADPYDILGNLTENPPPRALFGEVIPGAVRIYISTESDIEPLASALSVAFQTIVDVTPSDADLPFGSFHPDDLDRPEFAK